MGLCWTIGRRQTAIHVATQLQSKIKDTTLQDNGQKGKNVLMTPTVLLLSELTTKAAL